MTPGETLSETRFFYAGNLSMKHVLFLSTGKNVEPYCYTYNNNKCGTMLHDIHKVRFGCTPVFDNWKPPGSSCSVFYDCRK